MQSEGARTRQAAILSELEASTDELASWLRYYVVGSVIVTGVLLVTGIGAIAAEAVVSFVLVYWVGAALAVQKLRHTLSRLAALYLAIVPCSFSVGWLIFGPGPTTAGWLRWVDGVLFPLAIGLPGWRFVVLSFRYYKLERLAS